MKQDYKNKKGQIFKGEQSRSVSGTSEKALSGRRAKRKSVLSRSQAGQEPPKKSAASLQWRARVKITNELLKLFTHATSKKEYLDAAVKLIHSWSGCGHVGIRIADGAGNIPYASYAGFSPEFLKSENMLSVKQDSCVCTRVVLGKPEPQDSPAMTPKGSFYSNNRLHFLESLPSSQKGRFRSACTDCGFTSAAIIPLRYRDRILGAIHITDDREGMMPVESVEFLEQLALIVGEAVFRFGVEEELRQLNEELEKKVEERTAQLEAAYKEMESFSYSVSHDLRAPLRIIDGFSNILLEDYADKLDDKGKNLLKFIRGNTSKMDELICGLLDLSRIGRQAMQTSPLDMEKLAKSVFEELRATVPERDLRLNVKTLPAARGDLVLVRQVLTNLFSNAVKFTSKKEAAYVEVGGWSEEKEQIYYVKDNGVGFPEEYAHRVFGVFQRLHSSREFEGTGIGLSIVQRIIERHGGRVWAEGSVESGATFYFTLQK